MATEREAHQRGMRDSARNKPPIFRRVGSEIEAEGDDDMADEWDHAARNAYMVGYESE